MVVWSLPFLLWLLFPFYPSQSIPLMSWNLILPWHLLLGGLKVTQTPKMYWYRSWPVRISQLYSHSWLHFSILFYWLFNTIPINWTHDMDFSSHDFCSNSKPQYYLLSPSQCIYYFYQQYHFPSPVPNTGHIVHWCFPFHRLPCDCLPIWEISLYSWWPFKTVCLSKVAVRIYFIS